MAFLPLLFATPLLAAEPKAVTEPATPYLGVMVTSDATVIHVIPNMPAEETGLSPGDRITSLNGRTVKGENDLKKILSTLTPGEKVEITGINNGHPGHGGITPARREDHPLKRFPRYKVLEFSGPDNPAFDQLGKLPTLFYFTASWCGPCRLLAPDIEKFYRSFIGPQKDWMRFFAVAISDEPTDRVEYNALVKLQKSGHFSFTIFRADTIWETTGVNSMPTVLIVDPDGFIVGRYVGQDLADECQQLKWEVIQMNLRDNAKELPHFTLL